jgi:hypothetical protein
MHWDFYTVAAVASGATLILLAAFGGDSARHRLIGFAAGAAFAGYGLYVASQTSGTYYFPIVMFVIPIVGIVHFAKSLLARSRGPAGPSVLQTRGGAPQANAIQSWRSPEQR